MDTRKSLGMVFRCISMDLGRTLTFNINFRPPPPSEGPPWALAFLSGVTIFTFWTSDVSPSPCDHIEPNPAQGRWRVDST